MRQQEKLHLIGDVEGSTLFDGTNDVTIKTNLTKFKYMKNIITIRENTESNRVELDLPEGYNTSNCIIVSCMYYISIPGVTSEKNEEYKMVNSNKDISVSLQKYNKFKIEIKLETSSYIRNVYFKTLFYKYL